MKKTLQISQHFKLQATVSCQCTPHFPHLHSDFPSAGRDFFGVCFVDDLPLPFAISFTVAGLLVFVAGFYMLSSIFENFCKSSKVIFALFQCSLEPFCMLLWVFHPRHQDEYFNIMTGPVTRMQSRFSCFSVTYCKILSQCLIIFLFCLV